MIRDDTIFALATPPGRSGVAVIRLSGPACRFVVETIAPPLPVPRRAALRRVHSPHGAVIDEALVLWFPAPASFTGEDCAEIQCHGSPAVLRSLVEVLRGLGLRPAEPGEFARRALIKGRMDLAQVEGLAELIDADTEQQRRQALDQLSGRLGRTVDLWRMRLIESRALLEALLDFSDEEDVGATAVTTLVDTELSALQRDLAGALEDARRGMIVRHGFRVVIAGPPNAGKSTLFNTLARREIAIVTPHAGTTRDALQVDLELDGIGVRLVDTAGLRLTQDEVEALGIARAMEAAEGAGLVLWLAPADAPQDPPAAWQGPVLKLATKIDSCPDHAPLDWLRLSAVTGDALGLLRERIAAAARQAVGSEHPLLTRERHVEDCAEVLAALGRAREGLAADAWPELIAADLAAASHSLDRLTGRANVEEVLDAVFSRFCIGK